MADAGELLDGVEVGGLYLAAVDGRLLDDGVKHSGDGDIDAEERLAGDDGVVIDVGLRLAEDAEVPGVFQLDGGEGGRS